MAGGLINGGFGPLLFGGFIMRKTIFFCNLVSSTEMLTLSFVAWLSTFPMSGSPFHVIMTVVGTMGMTWSVLEWDSFVHADDLFEDSEVVE